MVCLEKQQGNNNAGCHLALEKRVNADESGWVVVHATGIGVDDLVNVCRLLGVLKE